jgi:ParB-like chromosome segregation protein Spo0J
MAAFSLGLSPFSFADKGETSHKGDGAMQMVAEKYQVMPPLTDEEYEALKADIAERGVQVPVEYDEEGNILDGYHRVRACLELGITDWPKIVRRGLTEKQKVEHALVLNLHRRHLTRDQRRELVAKLRGQGWSLRRIAERLGVSKSQVERDASGLSQKQGWDSPGFCLSDV